MPNPNLKSVHLNDKAVCTASDLKKLPGQARCLSAEDDQLTIPVMSLPPTDRIIVLDDAITHESSVRVRRSLQRFEQDSDEPVIVKINTPGGYIDEMFAIHDMLQTCPIVIITAIIGNAYSAGSIILQAGEIRVMSRNSALMLHKSSFPLQGTIDLDDLEQLTRDARFEEERAFDILMTRTGQPRHVIEKWHKGNTYMTTFEAFENNLADALLVPRDLEKEPLDRGLKSRAKRLTARVTEAFESLYTIADFASKIGDYIGIDGDGDEDDESDMRSKVANRTAVRPRLRLTCGKVKKNR